MRPHAGSPDGGPRLKLPAVALAALLLLPLASSLPLPKPSSPCNDWAPETLVDDACSGPIHPGAKMWNGCTLNWVVTDGTDLFIGTARHCVGDLGERLRVSGANGEVGTLVFRGRNDSAFFRIDPEDRVLVEPSLKQWGGARAGPTGTATRSPLPGEPLWHYGWGYQTQGQPVLRGREGVTLYGYATHYQFIFATPAVSGGDSGSPVMSATGEAIGHVYAGLFPLNLVCPHVPDCPDAPSHVALGVTLHTELRHWRLATGKTYTLVTGRDMITDLGLV